MTSCLGLQCSWLHFRKPRKAYLAVDKVKKFLTIMLVGHYFMLIVLDFILSMTKSIKYSYSGFFLHTNPFHYFPTTWHSDYLGRWCLLVLWISKLLEIIAPTIHVAQQHQPLLDLPKTFWHLYLASVYWMRYTLPPFLKWGHFQCGYSCCNI